ncbi:hypothetical protein ADK60_38890 [Streptomyces sp. XY431]|nr:hypothetical protein ADK60_38890 [Streptomyces sp. XY431]
MGDTEVRELRTLLPAVEAAVREVGARLAEQRPAEPCPEFGLAGAMARFAGYDGPAAAELRARPICCPARWSRRRRGRRSRTPPGPPGRPPRTASWPPRRASTGRPSHY